MQFYHLKDIMIIAYYCYAPISISPTVFLVNYNFVCSFKYLYIFYNFLPLHYISEENTVLVIYFVGWLLVYC